MFATTPTSSRPLTTCRRPRGARTLLALLPLLLAAHAHAIGNRTHAEISERAADRYCSGPQAMVPGLADFMADPEIRKALYAGSTFPDWGFAGIDHDAAEQSHWTPFLDVFFSVLKEQLHTPWTPEDAKNVAFFLGDISHSAADIPWHFDDAKNSSFLSAAKGANGCSHIDCDTGSDAFLVQREGVSPDLAFGDYYWPTDLLVEVYKRAGRDLPAAIVRTGGVRQQGYWLISKQVSDAKIGDYSARCPWIGENLEGYYYGGIDHNAAAVSNWFKQYFARLRGDFFFQNAPEYGRGAPEWVGYAGCTDTTLFAALPDTNAGAEPLLELLPDAKSVVLLRFDLAALPNDLAGAKATLWLATDGPAAFKDLEIAPCVSPWVEGVAASDPVTGVHGLADGKEGATWTQNDPTQLAWSPALPQTAAPGWRTLDVSGLVATWANAPEKNNGLALRLRGASAGKAVRIFSSEAWKSQAGPTGGERIALRPALVIETAK